MLQELQAGKKIIVSLYKKNPDIISRRVKHGCVILERTARSKKKPLLRQFKMTPSSHRFAMDKIPTFSLKSMALGCHD